LRAAGPGGRNADGTYLYTDAVSSDKDGATSSTEMPFLLPAGTGSPDTTTGGGVDVEHGYLVCSGLGETRCARVYQCWGRSNIPEAYRDAYAYEVAQCVRQQGAECRGLSNTTYGPQCPGSVFDPQGLRDCERLYALATCEEIMAAGTSLLPGCTSLCVN
jgi:hypothetical protein